MAISRPRESLELRPSHRCGIRCVDISQARVSLPVFRSIPCLHNPEFDTFTGIYAGSVKEAGLSITPNIAQYPSIVFECGWSESFPRLRSDKDLWIRGCHGHVKLVILIKFNKLAHGRVSEIVEVWAGDAAAND